MKLRTLLIVAFLCSCWALSGCPQISQSVNGPGNQVVDAPVAEAPPQGQDVAANAEPIDPKTDPRTIGGGTGGTGTAGTGGSDSGSSDGGRAIISGDALKSGPVQSSAFVDARLRYGSDSKILAKSPDASYVIRGKSAKITLSFTAELNWDPNLADSVWAALTNSFETKPQLRAVFIPADTHSHILYCDADWAPDVDGKVIYSFTDLLVSGGDELRFFLKENKTSDIHTGDLVPLVSGDPTQPFPADAEGTVYSLGAFQVKALVLSTPPAPIRQSDGQSLPLKF